MNKWKLWNAAANILGVSSILSVIAMCICAAIIDESALVPLEIALHILIGLYILIRMHANKFEPDPHIDIADEANTSF